MSCVIAVMASNYRKWTPRDPQQKDFGVVQVVVPKQCRLPILRLAHGIPLSGHLGIKKTKDRIMQNFYWPGIFSDVAEYCRSCPVCQKAARRRKGEVAKLGKMPILDEPFKRVAMDIVGKLNRSTGGNAYVLTIIDYATRYPEAILLRSIETERMCEALIDVFINFMSNLIGSICKDHGDHEDPYYTLPSHV